MNYTGFTQNIQQPVNDMSRRRKPNPKLVGARAAMLQIKNAPKPPDNMSDKEKKIWEIASSPHTGLQDEVYDAFVELVNSDRPIMPQKRQHQCSECTNT